MLLNLQLADGCFAVKTPLVHSSDAHGLRSDPWTQLTEEHGRMVRGVILQMVHDASVADDLAQEVFLRAMERRNQFDQSQGHLPQWLTGIAKHLVLDYLKSPGRRLRSAQLPDGAAPEPTVEHALVKSAEDRALRLAVDSLRPAQRQLIQLAYFQELPQTAIAEQLRRPLGTIKGRMRSALRQLRQALDREQR
ncbi:MAG: sigma-70 family RNA polymerase sigma factor [Bryobacteraceae bacterium]